MPDTAQAPARQPPSPPDETPRYAAADVIRHLAHELRQPLSTIESIAYYLEIILPKTEVKARQQIGKLQRMVHQSNWILADAIHFLHAAPARLELTDLAELVSQSLADWAAEETPDIRVEHAENLPLLKLDLGQVQHLLCSLFTFFEQVSRGQSIRVRVWAVEDRVCLRICCNAPDPEADALSSLFEPFSPHLPGGSGLALASVRRIADAHGATLDSQWDAAEGLSVTVAFPVPE